MENFAWGDANNFGTRHWAAELSSNGGGSPKWLNQTDTVKSTGTSKWVSTDSAGSGSLVTPKSRKCKYFIKY